MYLCACCLLVCLPVCPLAYVKKHTSKFHQISVHVTVDRSSSDGSAIRYILLVLWMTSCFHITEQWEESETMRMCRRVLQVAAPRAESVLSDCILLKFVH